MKSAMTLPNGLMLLIWGATLYGALSITRLPGNWGHSVCGAWGCGPPTQVLVGCHLAWVVLLAPWVLLVGRSDRWMMDSPQLLGKLFCLTGALLLLSVVIYQGATWWPAASEWHRNFFAQRCGFVIVTSVDMPMLQLLLLGLVMIRRGRRSPFAAEENVSLEAGE